LNIYIEQLHPNCSSAVQRVQENQIYIKNFILNTNLPSRKLHELSNLDSQPRLHLSKLRILSIQNWIVRGRESLDPRPAKQCILFVDDLNMPAKEKYGAQPPIELLRQFIDQGGWYEHKDKEKPFKHLVDIIPVAAMGPPGGGRTFITPRILRHLTLVSLTSFED
jgi:hypothetical protein